MSDTTNMLREVPPAPPPPAPTAKSQSTPFAIRIWCAFTFSLCAGMLLVGLYLHPNPAGTDTHTQLGLLPCGFYHMTGIPCPTCGCTTSVSHFSHGHFLTSFLTQPFGFALALLAIILIPLTVYGGITGRWIGPSMFTLGWHWKPILYCSLTYFILAWIFKIVAIKAGYH